MTDANDRSNQPDPRVQAASDWWTTGIIDIEPGQIHIRGYAVQDLIGQVSFVEMIWLMVRGELPTAKQAKLLEAALVPSVDHGPHAPSIAIARMASTCGIALNNAMASAINVLGDNHGGAGQDCMRLYEAVRVEYEKSGDLAAATDTALGAWIAENGKIIPGFGHRFHPVDPRCEPLIRLVNSAAAEGVVEGVYAKIGREVEAAIKRRIGRAIPMNIDGIFAVVLCELGFEPDMGRGLFILARTVGILAHASEQRKTVHRNKGPMPKEIPFTYAGPPRRKLER
jgi:citrate synthase